MDAISAAAMRMLTQWVPPAQEEEVPGGCTVGRIRVLVRSFRTAHSLSDDLLGAASSALERVARHADNALDETFGLNAGSELAGSLEIQKSKFADQPEVLHRQRRIWAIWKPPGWTVSVSDNEEEMLPELLTHATGTPIQEWIMKEHGSSFKIANDATTSHGFVQRLDRQTSGILLWANCYSGYFAARLQFWIRNVRKKYLCVCHGHVSGKLRLLDGRLITVQGEGQSLQSEVAERGRIAYTEICDVGHLQCPKGHPFSIVELELHTGLLHQIRVHLSSRGHPLAGDFIYGSKSSTWCPRVFLHAWGTCIDIGDGPLDVQIPLPADLHRGLSILMPLHPNAKKLLQKWLCPQ